MKRSEAVKLMAHELRENTNLAEVERFTIRKEVAESVADQLLTKLEEAGILPPEDKLNGCWHDQAWEDEE